MDPINGDPAPLPLVRPPDGDSHASHPKAPPSSPKSSPRHKKRRGRGKGERRRLRLGEEEYSEGDWVPEGDGEVMEEEGGRVEEEMEEERGGGALSKDDDLSMTGNASPMR